MADEYISRYADFIRKQLADMQVSSNIAPGRSVGKTRETLTESVNQNKTVTADNVIADITEYTDDEIVETIEALVAEGYEPNQIRDALYQVLDGDTKKKNIVTELSQEILRAYRSAAGENIKQQRNLLNRQTEAGPHGFRSREEWENYKGITGKTHGELQKRLGQRKSARDEAKRRLVSGKYVTPTNRDK